MYSLRIREDDMREPHWHPITAELGYVHRGNARMTVMDPDGTMDTWSMQHGDVYFVPRAYPHHIEVVDSPDIHFLHLLRSAHPRRYRIPRTSVSADRPAGQWSWCCGCGRTGAPNARCRRTVILDYSEMTPHNF